MHSAIAELGAWTPGTVIDDLYQIEDLIGLGAMGAVFQAHHLRWEIDVAIKVARPDVEHRPDLRERLIFEGEAWIGLGVHPNIVQCFFIREYFGLPALFLDFLTGGSLKDWMADGLIPATDLPRILDFAIQAADGLAYAHGHGIIHRDVKPANLLIRGDGCLCVTDFGIVKTLSPNETGKLGLSHEVTGYSDETTLGTQVAGTMGYGAPEQWIQRGVVSPAADIYALGVVLYELLCGHRPFAVLDNDPVTLLLQQRDLDAPPIEKPIPDSLQEIVMSSLQRAPEKRPPSAQHMRAALARCYQEVTGETYPREVPEAGRQRAATMNNRAASLYHLGKDEEALRLWRQASLIDGKHQDTLYNRLRCEWEKTRIEARDAEWKLREAGAYYRMGLFCLQVGHHQAAVEALTKAVQQPIEADSSSIYRALGHAYMYCGVFPEATEAYRQALKLRPDDGEALLGQRLAGMQKRADQHTYFPSSKARKFAQAAGPVIGGKYHEATGLVALVCRDSASLWEVSSGKCLWTRNLSAPLVDFDFDHQHFYTLGDAPARVWRISNGTAAWLNTPLEWFLCVSTEFARGVMAGSGYELVDLASGDPLQRLTGVEAPLTCGGFTAGGRMFLAGDEQGKVGVWRVEDGECTARFQVGQGKINSLIPFAGQASVLVTSENAVKVVDLVAHEVLAEMTLQETPKSIELSPDERVVVIRLFPTEKHSDYLVWQLGEDRVRRARGAYAFLGKDYVLCDREGAIELWSLPRRRRLRRFAEHKQNLTFLSPILGGRYLLSASAQQRVEVWDLDEDHRVVERELMFSRSRSHTESEITRQAYSERIGKARKLFQAESYGRAYGEVKQALRVSGYERDVEALNLVADLSRFLARTTLAGIWERWSTKLTRSAQAAAIDFGNDVAFTLCEGEITVHDSCQDAFKLDTGTEVTSFCHLRTTSNLLLASDNRLQVFDLKRGQTRGPSIEFADRITGLTSGGDGRLALVRSADSKCYVLESAIKGSADEGMVLHSSFKAATSESGWMATTPNMNFGLAGPKWQLWDLRKAKLLLDPKSLKVSSHRPVKKNGVFQAGALTDDGRVAIAACPEAIISVWDTETGRCRGTMSGHTDTVVYLAIWNHLHVAVSASWDGFIMFWDLATGSVLRRYEPHSGKVLLAFADPFGRFLMTVGADKFLRVWELEWELDHKSEAISLLEALGPARTMDRLGSLLRGR